MRECSSCQAANDDKSAFCLECGQKLAPLGRQPGPEDQGTPGRQRLHSPILGGYEDVDDSPRRPAEKSRPLAPKGSKPAAHLRSPLLGGSDDDDDYEEQQQRPSKSKGQPSKSGGKMRSPLLGGAPGGDQGDYEEDFPLRDRNDDRSPFPHRSRPREVDHQEQAPPAQPHAASTGNKHLRSPLLGGSDDDYEEGAFQQNQPRNAGSSGRPQKLHSPIFDRQGGGGFNDYDDDDDGGEIDDPSVLRSPLLAAKSRVPLDNRPKQPGSQQLNQPNQYNSAPQQPQQPPPPGYPQQGAPQPGYGQAPGGYPQQAPNQSQPVQPGFAPPAPPQPATGFATQAAQPAFNSPPLPPQPGFAPPAFAPQSPTAQSTGYEFGAPGASAANPGSLFLTPPTPAGQPLAPVEPVRPMLPTDIGPSTTSGALGVSSPGFAGMPLDAKVRRDMSATIQESALDASVIEQSLAATVSAPAPVAKTKLKGGRFGTPAVEPTDDFDDEPQAPTRKGSSPGRRFDSSSDNNFSVASHAPAGAPSGPIMVIFITAFLAGVAKLWYFASFFQSFMGNMPMLADQIGQIAVIVGLIIFAMKGTQK